MRYAKTFFAALALTLVAGAATTPAVQNLGTASVEFENGDILIIIGDDFIVI